MQTIRIFLTTALVALLACACVEKPDSGPQGGGGDEPGGDTPAEKAEDLEFTSFRISPDANDRIYAELSLEADKQNEMHGVIEYYKTDLSKIVVSFESNAARVTVAGKEQRSGVTANDFSGASGVTYRLHTPKGDYKEFRVRLENKAYTGIPLVVIRTDGNKPVDSKEIWRPGSMKIDRQTEDCAEFGGKIEIKGRGNNTWAKEKKPYAIKLAEKSEIMGMPKQKRWVLLANASDRTLLRNRAAFEIGKMTSLAWTPDTRFVNVILNGRFLGNYLLGEQIRIDKNRVNITEMGADDLSGDAVTGGYLIEVDRYYDEPDNAKFMSAYADLPFMLKNPDADAIQPKQMEYIRNYVNNVEKLLYAGEQADARYKDSIDVRSFADWWIVHELAHNTDATLPGSCYMHKDRLGKLFAGPIWDFDLATFKESFDFKDMNAMWYGRLFTDPSFRKLVQERWTALKPSFETIPAFIDREADYLAASAEQNWSMWTIDGNYNQDESLPWREAVEKMKKNYASRLQWMDGKISSPDWLDAGN